MNATDRPERSNQCSRRRGNSTWGKCENGTATTRCMIWYSFIRLAATQGAKAAYDKSVAMCPTHVHARVAAAHLARCSAGSPTALKQVLHSALSPCQLSNNPNTLYLLFHCLQKHTHLSIVNIVSEPLRCGHLSVVLGKIVSEPSSPE